jgi:hypothetical protein
MLWLSRNGIIEISFGLRRAAVVDLVVAVIVAGVIAIAGTVTGSTVNLTTTGKATETAQASIAASTVLNVTATSGIKLTSKHNAIKKLGTDITVSGPNKVTL